MAASAGNEGPGAGTANHLSPWITTVAASTQLRAVPVHLTLVAGADTFTAIGSSITAGVDEPAPVVLAGRRRLQRRCAATSPAAAAPSRARSWPASAASTRRVVKGYNVLLGGAAAVVLYNPTQADIETDNHWLPTMHLADGTDFVAFMAAHTRRCSAASPPASPATASAT